MKKYLCVAGFFGIIACAIILYTVVTVNKRSAKASDVRYENRIEGSIDSGKLEYLGKKKDFKEDSLDGNDHISDNNGEFFLTIDKKEVVVFMSDKTTVFLRTGMHESELTTMEQEELRKGYFVKDEETLYSVLENFTS